MVRIDHWDRLSGKALTVPATADPFLDSLGNPEHDPQLWDRVGKTLARPLRLVRSSIPMPVGQRLQQPIQLVPGVAVPGVGDPLQLAQIASRDRASCEQETGVQGSLIQQLAQLHEVAGCIGKVGHSAPVVAADALPTGAVTASWCYVTNITNTGRRSCGVDRH